MEAIRNQRTEIRKADGRVISDQRTEIRATGRVILRRDVGAKAPGGKAENLEKRWWSKKMEEMSEALQAERSMPDLCKTKTAKVGHPGYIR